jgi:hypothetical protein
MTRSRLPTSAHPLFPPCFHYYPRALAQRDLGLWPSTDCSPIGCDRRFEIIDPGDVLDEVVTGTVPNIDPEGEVGLRFHGRPLATAIAAQDATTNDGRENRARTQERELAPSCCIQEEPKEELHVDQDVPHGARNGERT